MHILVLRLYLCYLYLSTAVYLFLKLDQGSMLLNLEMPLRLNNLTFLQVLHPLSMRPAREGDIPVRVKNSYNPRAPGTIITKNRDMSEVSTSELLNS